MKVNLVEKNLSPKAKREIRDRYKSIDSKRDRANARYETETSDFNKMLNDMRGTGSITDSDIDKAKSYFSKATAERTGKAYYDEHPISQSDFDDIIDSGDVEAEDYPYYVSHYEEYPVYEPAEGGYYVSGNELESSKGFKDKKSALKYASELSDEISDGREVIDLGDNKHHVSRYVGSSGTVSVEPRKRQGSRAHSAPRYESLKEDFKMEDVDIKKFLKKVASVGFVLDPAIKHENPEPGFFRSLHFQLIDDTDFVGSDDENFDEGLFDKVARDLIEAISEFEEEFGYRATYSIGVNNEGYATAGVDIREGRSAHGAPKYESLKESVRMEDIDINKFLEAVASVGFVRNPAIKRKNPDWDYGYYPYIRFQLINNTDFVGRPDRGDFNEGLYYKLMDDLIEAVSEFEEEFGYEATQYKTRINSKGYTTAEVCIMKGRGIKEAFDTPFEKKSKKEQDAENKKRRGELIPPNKTFKDRKKEFDKNKARGKGRYDESVELDEGAAGTLADRIRKGKLDRDAEYDDIYGDLYDDNNPNSNHTATEGEYMVQFQDRTTNTHTPRNPRDGYRNARYETHPRVKSNTWARVWKNGDIVYNNGGESRYTARQNAARYLDSIDECRKVEAVETRRYRNNRNENKYITTKRYPDGHYYEKQTMEWDTPRGKVVNQFGGSKSAKGRFHRARDSKKQAWFDDYTEITEE